MKGEGAVPLVLHPAEKAETRSGFGAEWLVDDVDALVGAVKSSGTGKVVQEPVDREWGVREAVIEDPDGYQLWFVQPLK